MALDRVPFSGPSWQIFSLFEHLEPSSPEKPEKRHFIIIFCFLCQIFS